MLSYQVPCHQMGHEELSRVINYVSLNMESILKIYVHLYGFISMLASDKQIHSACRFT